MRSKNTGAVVKKKLNYFGEATFLNFDSNLLCPSLQKASNFFYRYIV